MIILKSARLSNFIGNLKGTKTKDVILKFNDSGVINFQGKNGSGKTSTLRLLHPYSDGKEELIVDKEASTDEKIVYIPAEKELDYIVNGQTVKVKVIYSKAGTKKCFLSIDGVEQNANGNTTSFNTLVEKTFGFADDLLTNRLVTTVKSNNFLELSPIQRKTEISSLLPNIEKYVLAYKTVNEKVKAFNLRVKFLVSEINSLSGLSDLEKLLASYEDNLNKNNEFLEEYLNICNQKRAVVGDLSAELNVFKNKYNIQDISTLCNTLQNEISSKKSVLENLAIEENKYVFNYEESIKTEINDLEHSIDTLRKEQDVAMQNLREFYSEINEISKQQNELKNIESSILSIEKNLNDEVTYKNSLESDINKASNLEPIDSSKETQEKFTYLFTQINTLNNFIQKYSVTKEQVDSYEKINERFLSNTRSLESMISNYNNLNGTNTAYISMLKMADEFDNKLGDLKSSCDLASCKDTITGKSIEICGYMEDIAKGREKLESEIESDRFFISNIIPTLTLIKLGVNHLYPEKNTTDDFFNSITDVFARIQSYLSRVSEYEKSVTKIQYTNSVLETVKNKITNYNNQLNNLTKQKVGIMEKNQYANLDVLFNSTKEKADDTNTRIESYKVSLNKLSNELRTKKEVLQKFLNRPNEAILNKEIDLLSNDLSSIYSFLEKLNEAHTETNAYVEKYNAYFSNKENIQKSITETQTLINVVNKYSAEYADLNTKIANYNKILEALHISKGLPSVISSKILSVIQDDCNDMIKIMFNEQFAINFVNTEKELSLMVFNSYNGEVSEYSMLSGGEQSIIKMVLSLSLLKFKIGDAGSSIIRLDEIDAFLDDENRQSFDLFLDLLMSEKGVNQLFLISHNVSLSGQRVHFDKDNKTIKVYNSKLS